MIIFKKLINVADYKACMFSVTGEELAGTAGKIPTAHANAKKKDALLTLIKLNLHLFCPHSALKTCLYSYPPLHAPDSTHLWSAVGATKRFD